MSTDTREKIFVRLHPDRAKLFKDTIKNQSSTLTQQDVLEQLVENYLAHAAEGQIRHLDGTVCPISVLIKGLTESVEAQYKLMHGALRSFNATTPPP